MMGKKPDECRVRFSQQTAGGLVCVMVFAACVRATLSSAENKPADIAPTATMAAFDERDAQFTEGLVQWRSANSTGDETSKAAAMQLMRDAIRSRAHSAPGSWHADFGRFLFEEQLYEDARRHLQVALEDETLSHRGSTVALLAECHAELGDIADAEALLSLAASLSPRACGPIRASLNVHRIRKNYPAAALSAIRLAKPECVTPADNLALALLARDMRKLGEARLLLADVMTADAHGPWGERAASAMKALDE